MKSPVKLFAIAIGLLGTISPAFATEPSAMGMVNPTFVSYSAPYNVQLNKTEVLRLSEPASAVIVGNPSIADVSVHASDTLLLIGRGYGTTNLLVLNGRGQVMMNTDIQVIPNQARGNVRVYNGNVRYSYNCQNSCEPAPMLGDDPDYIKNNKAKIPETNASTTTTAASAYSERVELAMEKFRNAPN